MYYSLPYSMVVNGSLVVELSIPGGWWIFLIAGIVAILIALITVSFQSIKAGLANPVNRLEPGEENECMLISG